MTATAPRGFLVGTMTMVLANDEPRCGMTLPPSLSLPHMRRGDSEWNSLNMYNTLTTSFKLLGPLQAPQPPLLINRVSVSQWLRLQLYRAAHIPPPTPTTQPSNVGSLVYSHIDCSDMSRHYP
jgi:hypothetical protein